MEPKRRTMQKAPFVFVLLLILGCVPEQKLAPENPFIIAEGGKPWIIAHGGSKALWPENTMMAFDGSAALGVDALEMDVCLTKDSILVTHHDETIDRMSDGEGKVADYTYKELLQYNFGDGFTDLDGNQPYLNAPVRITRLDSVMAKYGHFPFVIEIKDEGKIGERAADVLERLIEQYDMVNRTIIASFHDEIIEYYLKISEEQHYVSTPKKATTKLVLTSRSRTGLLHWPKAVATQVPMESSGIGIDKKRVVKSVHKHNMAIHYWTINDKDDMKDLIEIGADGLITDRPDIMIEVLEELGKL
ncbi:MAG: glycerophosphodiester phosphodiesterase [Bacteroidetes bacterium]|nr:glycerophosphodiester phosphodiesterase [Bacteroidota bacterium]